MKCFSKVYNLCEYLPVIACLLCTCWITEAADECELPGGSRGECVELAACAQYVTLLKESTTTELGLKLTQERRCGLHERNLKVCCPTVTEVPAPESRMRSDDVDFEDELPDPPNCGHYSSMYYYVTSDDEQPAYSLRPQYPAQARYEPGVTGLSRSRGRRDTFYDGGTLPDYGDEGRRGVPTASNGVPVTTKLRFLAQWMALLAYRRSPSVWGCGGSILTKRHVLTAAHCIKESLYVVRVGELDLAKTEKEFNPIDFYIKKKIPHEQYHKYHNDIAILVLDGTIPYDDPYTAKYVAPVCLPAPGSPYADKELTSTFITGWGETEKNERPTNLLFAYLDIVDQDICKRVYSDAALTIDERVFCAGDPSNGRDACNGDSGGPLIGQYYLNGFNAFYQLGLISYGFSCSAKRYIGVYTNVTHFMSWVREKVTGKTGPRRWTDTTPVPFGIPYGLPAFSYD